MKKTSPHIQFHYLYKTFSLRHRSELKSFIPFIFNAEGVVLNELHYIFCSDSYLLDINSTFLNHHTYTDIITFRISEPSEPVFSDIYISVERVKENAVTFKSSFTYELHRVIIHGVLHLCGYKDKTKAQ